MLYFNDVENFKWFKIILSSSQKIIMIRLLLTITTICCFFSIQAQVDSTKFPLPTYSYYKPDLAQMTISGEIVPIKTVAVESRFLEEIIEKDNYAFNLNETLIRIGMMELMEMTVGFRVPATLINGQSNFGMASPKLGLKVFLKRKSIDSKMGIIFAFDGSINFGTEDFKDTKILPSFRVAADVDFSSKTNLRLNYGAAWKENRLVLDPEGNPVIDPFIELAGSINQKLGKRVILYVEVAASLKYNNFRSSYFLNTGLQIPVKKNVFVHVGGGAGLSPDSPRGSVQVGFSGLWPKKNLSF